MQDNRKWFSGLEKGVIRAHLHHQTAISDIILRRQRCEKELDESSWLTFVSPLVRIVQRREDSCVLPQRLRRIRRRPLNPVCLLVSERFQPLLRREEFECWLSSKSSARCSLELPKNATSKRRRVESNPHLQVRCQLINIY